MLMVMVIIWCSWSSIIIWCISTVQSNFRIVVEKLSLSSNQMGFGPCLGYQNVCPFLNPFQNQKKSINLPYSMLLVHLCFTKDMPGSTTYSYIYRWGWASSPSPWSSTPWLGWRVGPWRSTGSQNHDLSSFPNKIAPTSQCGFEVLYSVLSMCIWHANCHHTIQMSHKDYPLLTSEHRVWSFVLLKLFV
jgi:hypothetical protein